ncbi:3876_t:CDS:2, partial [Dentiscutata heterogama]
MLSLQPKIPEVGSEFSTAESFKEAAQQGAKAAGFAFSVSSSKLSCSEKETKKKIKSIKCQNCPVTLYAVLNENAGIWVVRSYKKQHNYELLPPLQVYYLYQHQQLNAEQKKLVHIMLKSGALLLQKLEKRNYILRHLLSKDGYMRNLFFTHIEAASHTAVCPEELIVNANYKTNLYKLPLINAVGVSNIGNAKSLNMYQIAIAWVENEKKYTYEWFLNTLKDVIYDAYFCSPEVLFQIDYDKLLLLVQKIAYAEEMNIVEEAFDE